MLNTSEIMVIMTCYDSMTYSQPPLGESSSPRTTMGSSLWATPASCCGIEAGVLLQAYRIPCLRHWMPLARPGHNEENGKTYNYLI